MVALVSALRPDLCVVAEFRASPNHGERQNDVRPDMIVLHYTGMADADAALDKLCSPNSKVSCHYVVMEDGYIVQCVPEARRAWHAGESSWEGESDINSRSIGIEIVNPGHDQGYPEFPKRQIAAVQALCRSVFTRHRVPPHCVVGHSDIAPSRKRDPGEKFPWQRLYESGIGLWVAPAAITRGGHVFSMGESGPVIREVQMQLADYGYGVPTTGEFDAVTRDVVAAFQRHFRPARVDGVADNSTLVTIRTLLAARAALKR